jgi:hypothetical protein
MRLAFFVPKRSGSAAHVESEHSARIDLQIQMAMTNLLVIKAKVSASAAADQCKRLIHDRADHAIAVGSLGDQ